MELEDLSGVPPPRRAARAAAAKAREQLKAPTKAGTLEPTQSRTPSSVCTSRPYKSFLFPSTFHQVPSSIVNVNPARTCTVVRLPENN